MTSALSSFKGLRTFIVQQTTYSNPLPSFSSALVSIIISQSRTLEKVSLMCGGREVLSALDQCQCLKVCMKACFWKSISLKMKLTDYVNLFTASWTASSAWEIQFQWSSERRTKFANTCHQRVRWSGFIDSTDLRSLLDLNPINLTTLSFFGYQCHESFEYQKCRYSCLPEISTRYPQVVILVEGHELGKIKCVYCM